MLRELQEMEEGHNLGRRPYLKLVVIAEDFQHLPDHETGRGQDHARP